MLRMIKIFAVKWKKEWKNVSSDGARVGSNLFLLFSNLRRIYGAIDEKIIMFTHVAPTPQQKF